MQKYLKNKVDTYLTKLTLLLELFIRTSGRVSPVSSNVWPLLAYPYISILF